MATDQGWDCQRLPALGQQVHTQTASAPLDVEAEMAAVLDAVTGIADPGAQVRVLEVASLSAIRQALARDAYHVLHLSAHGSADLVELEDEDGAPAPVTAQVLWRSSTRVGRCR